MQPWQSQLRGKAWGLARARAIAAKICVNKAAVRALLRDLRRRHRAAQALRRRRPPHHRTRPHSAPPLGGRARGLLESLPLDEARTRRHLGLVVPRVAHTSAQRLRAVRAMSLLAEDPGNVVRSSAVEGLATLALADPALRDQAEAMDRALPPQQ